MSDFFRNPELVRHLRAELRAPRMLLSGGLALVLCFLIAMVHSQTTAGFVDYAPGNVARTLFFWLAIIQGIVLPLWCLSSSTQAIASERQLKTYDFVRTTRLNSLELLLGYLFGVPIMAYFTVGVTVVVALLSGLGTGISPVAMLATYLLLIVFAIFVSLFGLMISMLVEKPRAAGSLVIVWFLLWPLSSIGMLATRSPFPGISALGLVPGLVRLFDPASAVPYTAPFFGVQMPILFLSIILYGSFGAWIALALVRNLKKEREEIQLLSRPQALIFVAYMNFLFLGLYDAHYTPPNDMGSTAATGAVVMVFVFMNQAMFYVVGLATLTPPERLKMWYRDFKAGSQSYLSEHGLPWPWMCLAGGIAFIGVAVSGIAAQSSTHQIWTAGPTALSVIMVLIYAVRDILFLQWCLLTKMKSPVLKGIGLIWLYYTAAAIVSSVFAVYPNRSLAGLVFLTPARAFIAEGNLDSAIAGIALQVALSGAVLYLINQRLGQMDLATAAAA